MTHDDAKVYPKAAVIGWPVHHSLSPRLHGYWLKQYGLKGSYERLAVEPSQLEETLKNLQANGYSGVNLTLPHKERAMSLATTVDATGRRVGAINTLRVGKDGALIGSNTDVFGFSQNLVHSGFVQAGRPALVLGAGGAARAAVVALCDMKFPEIRVINRTFDRAQSIANDLEGPLKAYEWGDVEACKDVGLLVNATSLGLNGLSTVDLDLTALPGDATVMDMVYTPLITDLLLRSARRGLKTIDGLGMLLHQARPAFLAFFGRDPEVTEALRTFVLETA